jgi:two-component system NtrC family sensor kinase
MNAPNNRILIVDDNPSIRDDYRRILCPSTGDEEQLETMEAILFDEMREHQSKVKPNFQTAFASQGEAAASLAQSAMDQGMPFAVAIVDVRMPPGIDGVETVRRLWRVQTDLQIILCTAYSDYSWQQIVQELGASHRLVVLKKPFDPIEVLQLCLAMSTKWGTEREMAYRQLDLQSRLATTVQRAERVAGELHQERRFRENLEQKRSDAEVIDVMSGLASSIAHDFNNVLTVIQGHLSTALMHPADSGALLPMEQMFQASQRAAFLSRQIMALTDAVESPSEMHVLSALPVIQQQVEMMSRVLKDKLRIELYFTGADLYVCASEPLLSRLLNLMVIRAQEQVPRGGHLSIMITSKEKAGSAGKYMLVELSHNLPEGADTAAAEKQERERLSSAMRLAESLGGCLNFETRGATYVQSLFLPEADPKQPQDAVQRLMTARTVTAGSGKQLTFMVIDDERSICDILGYMLSTQGHRVLKAQSALEAWTLWQEHGQEIDLVIADVYLPDGLTGFDLVRHLRASAPALPVIYMSGFQPSLMHEMETLIVGVNYITKPFDVLDLLNVIARALETSTPTQTVSVPALPSFSTTHPTFA